MNTSSMEQFNVLNADALATVVGRGGNWWGPLLPGYEQFLSSVCGFLDGVTGRKHKGSC